METETPISGTPSSDAPATAPDPSGTGPSGTDPYAPDPSGTALAHDGSGILDEALERLHSTGPEHEGWLSNHAPMAVEALVRRGQAHTVHRWIDAYRDKLEDMPAPLSPVHDDNWQEALGDPRRLADWIVYFGRQLDASPWRHVLAEWWPRLLPGIAAAATHPVIRTGHAVRTLLLAEQGNGANGASAGDGGTTAATPDGPLYAELAHALGYWAARHHFLTGIGESAGPADGGPRTAYGALDAVPLVPLQEGGIRDRLARITELPARPGAAEPDAEGAREELARLVRAATHRYATHGYGEPVMLVHAATAPNAVLRVLPALPRELWLPSLDAAWSASAAVTAAYAPSGPGAPPPDPGGATPEELFARVAAHGDEHAVKLADTALDADEPAAMLRVLEWIEPLPGAGRGGG